MNDKLNIIADRIHRICVAYAGTDGAITIVLSKELPYKGVHTIMNGRKIYVSEELWNLLISKSDDSSVSQYDSYIESIKYLRSIS